MDCGGHGTHVAGIIGADPGNDFGVVGNAYKASISGYRVFGCSGSTTDESKHFPLCFITHLLIPA